MSSKSSSVSRRNRDIDDSVTRRSRSFSNNTSRSPSSYNQSSKDRENSNKGNCLYLKNLSPKIDETALGEAFKTCGAIKNIQIIYNPYTKESRGFGFITFNDEKSANEAILRFNNQKLDDRVITVELSNRNGPRDNTPGRYLGKRPNPYPDRDRHYKRYEHTRHYDRYEDRYHRPRYDRYQREDNYNMRERHSDRYHERRYPERDHYEREPNYREDHYRSDRPYKNYDRHEHPREENYRRTKYRDEVYQEEPLRRSRHEREPYTPREEHRRSKNEITRESRFRDNY